jgi:glucose 1-dehydrogenase
MSKTAIITGASSGIGEAIALEFGVEHKMNVVVNYHSDEEEAQRVVHKIERGGAGAVAVQGDVSKKPDVQKLIDAALNTFGGVDVLVNNAGVEFPSPFLEKSEKEWDMVIGINLTGPFLCSQAAARVMADAGKGGTIINISSVHEDLPFPGYTAYCASKGGLRMLCRNLAVELARYQINVVNIGPGAVATPINEKTLTDPEKKSSLLKEIPLGRVAAPEEIAKLAAFLASDEAKYITGTTIFIDGGLMRQTGSL